MRDKPPISLSPSVINHLLDCRLRPVLLSDPQVAASRRPTPASCLGLVSHELLEEATRGSFDNLPPGEVRGALEAAWSDAIERHAQDLREAWPLAEPPPPERWPGYQLTRVSLLRSLGHRVEARRRLSGGTSESGAVEVEAWLRDPETGLVGRVDRAEIDSDGRVHVVDLKAGWSQEATLTPSQRRQLLLYAYLWHQEHGVWPTSASIQLADGRRVSMQVDPDEARALVSVALETVAEIEAARARGAEGELASPSPETCRNCPCRGDCRPHLAALSDEWGWYRQTVLGTVAGTDELDTNRFALRIRVEGGTLPSEVRDVRLIGVPTAHVPSDGTRVVVLDADPMGSPADLRVTWRTQMLTRAG